MPVSSVSGDTPVPHSVRILDGSHGVVCYSDHIRRLILLRFHRAADGRWEVEEVYLPPDPGVPLRSEHLLVPLARLEALINSPGYRDRLLASFQGPKLSMEGAMLLLAGLPAQVREREQQMERLDIPTARRYPDSFYEQLAELYGAWAAEGRRPAAAIAEANGIPVSQVHGWIKEARRRGVLSPGRPGKAG